MPGKSGEFGSREQRKRTDIAKLGYRHSPSSGGGVREGTLAELRERRVVARLLLSQRILVVRAVAARRQQCMFIGKRHTVNVSLTPVY